MNTNDAIRQCRELLTQHGLTEQGWRPVYDNAKRRAGQCSYTHKLIKLSRPLTELGSEADVLNTIRHEVAHALCPGHNHDGVWKAKFRELGGTGERTYSSDRPTPKLRYQTTCTGCGKEYSRAHNPKMAVFTCQARACRSHPRLIWTDSFTGRTLNPAPSFSTQVPDLFGSAAETQQIVDRAVVMMRNNTRVFRKGDQVLIKGGSLTGKQGVVDRTGPTNVHVMVDGQRWAIKPWVLEKV